MRQNGQGLLTALSGVQVYVSVYSDGPTRVLRFSDEPNISSSQAEQSILDLAARLKQARILKMIQKLTLCTIRVQSCNVSP